MVIVTCFHGRPKVSELFLAHTSPLLPIYAACSEGDRENIELCERYGVHFCVVPNNPLGAKWNAALALVPSGEDVMILGSDDFVSRQWIDITQQAMQEGKDYVTPSACGMFDLDTGQACILRRNGHGAQIFGAGRVLSARVIETVCPMWTADKGRALDSDAHAKVVGSGFVRHTLDSQRVPVTDVKSGENLWGYQTWAWCGKVSTKENVLWMVTGW